MIIYIIIGIFIGWMIRDIISGYRSSAKQKKLIDNMNNWRNEKYEKEKIK